MGLTLGLQFSGSSRSAPTLPATQSINFGAKTLKGYGGHALGYTGTGYLKVTAGDASAIWTIDAYNKLVPSGTYGAAAPVFGGPYTLTVTEYSDAGRTVMTGVVSVVSVTIVASAYHVAWRADNQADLFDAVPPEIEKTLEQTGLAFSDLVYARPGTYNPASADVRLTKYRATDPTGVWSGSNWVRVISEVAGAAIFVRAGVDNSGFLPRYLRFEDWGFTRTNSGGTAADSTQVFQLNNSSNTMSFLRCAFYGDPATVVSPATPSTSLCNGLNSSTSTDIEVRDCTFDKLFRGINLGGKNVVLVGNGLTNIWEDMIQLTDPQNWQIDWNDMYHKKSDEVEGGHPDFIALEEPGKASGVYVGGSFIGNRMFRGTGLSGRLDGQGITMNDPGPGVTYTGVTARGNGYNGTFAHFILLWKCVSPEVSFNQGISDEVPGLVAGVDIFDATIGLSSCNGGNVRYNALTGGIQEVTPAVAATVANNVVSIGQTAAGNAALFTSPKYGANNTSPAQVIVDWGMKVGGNLDTLYTFKVGAYSTGYVDYANRTTSFPV